HYHGHTAPHLPKPIAHHRFSRHRRTNSLRLDYRGRNLARRHHPLRRRQHLWTTHRQRHLPFYRPGHGLVTIPSNRHTSSRTHRPRPTYHHHLIPQSRFHRHIVLPTARRHRRHHTLHLDHRHRPTPRRPLAQFLRNHLRNSNHPGVVHLHRPTTRHRHSRSSRHSTIHHQHGRPAFYHHRRHRLRHCRHTLHPTLRRHWRHPTLHMDSCCRPTSGRPRAQRRRHNLRLTRRANRRSSHHSSHRCRAPRPTNRHRPVHFDHHRPTHHFHGQPPRRPPRQPLHPNTRSHRSHAALPLVNHDRRTAPRIEPFRNGPHHRHAHNTRHLRPHCPSRRPLHPAAHCDQTALDPHCSAAQYHHNINPQSQTRHRLLTNPRRRGRHPSVSLVDRHRRLPARPHSHRRRHSRRIPNHPRHLPLHRPSHRYDRANTRNCDHQFLSPNPHYLPNHDTHRTPGLRRHRIPTDLPRHRRNHSLHLDRDHWNSTSRSQSLLSRRNRRHTHHRRHLLIHDPGY